MTKIDFNIYYINHHDDSKHGLRAERNLFIKTMGDVLFNSLVPQEEENIL